MLAVRGHRQVGKSRLLTHFVEASGLPYLYFTALKRGSLAQQMDLLQAAVRTAKRPLPNADAMFFAPPVNWRDALGRIAVACRETPAIVVLDELPWALETDPTLEGVLKIAWDTELQHCPVLFVIIGSDVAMMEHLQEHGRPLYGIPRPLVIGPFTPPEVGDAAGSSNAVEAFDAYLVTGGYPGLVADLARSGGFSSYVAGHLSDPNSGLMTVARLTLDAELADAAQARRVLSAIGWQDIGFATFTGAVRQIAEEGSAAQTATTRALKHLVEMKGLVSVEVPLDAHPRSRLRRYRINDPYLRFWFRFAERHLDNVARGRPDIALAELERSWENWRGRAIEPVVRESVFRLSPTESAIAGIERVGSWWDRNNSHEYDIVGAASGGDVVVVGSTKWRRSAPFDAAAWRHLVGARSVIPASTAAKLIVVSPTGVAKGVQVDALLTPDRLLDAWR